MDVNCLLLADAMELVELMFESQQEFCQFAYDGLSRLSATLIVAFPLFVAVLITTLIGRRVLVPSAKYVLWSLVLIRLILPVSFTSPINLQRGWSLMGLKIATNRADRAPLLSVENRPMSGPLGHLSIDSDSSTSSMKNRQPSSSVLFWLRSFGFQVAEIWPAWLFAGSSFIACGSIVGFARWISWWRNSRACSDPLCVELVNDGRRRFGIRANVRLRMIRQSTCPTTFDWFWPVIFLPKSIASYSESERRHLIWHELARIRRGDSATSVLWHLVRIVHWWNILFLWAQYRWLAAREMACDALAITQIPTEEIALYAATLARVHQAQPKSTWFAWWTRSPGFVAQTDSMSVLHQRQKVLAIPQTSGSRAQALMSWSVVIALAAAGLTDPPAIPLAEIPIELPAGTTWHDSPVLAVSNEELETREYDLIKCIERLEQQDPTTAREVHAESVCKAIRKLSLPARETKSSQSSFQMIDDRLIVDATPTQHIQIAELISNWETHGRRQICVEVRSIPTERQLSQLLPATGGRVFNSDLVIGKHDEADEPLGIDAGASFRESIQSPSPVFAQVLSDSQARFMVLKAQGDRRIHVLFAPKVTLFDGDAANIADVRQRPYVTGFVNLQTGSHQPKISTVEEGLSIHVLGLITAERIRLRFSLRASSIADVSTQKFLSGSNELSIQAPEVTEQQCDVVTDVRDRETLLLVPLKRVRGELRMYIITPRIIDEVEEDLIGVPRIN